MGSAVLILHTAYLIKYSPNLLYILVTWPIIVANA